MLVRTIVATILLLPPMRAVAQSIAQDWISDPQTGCRVVNPNPQPNESITWSGGCQNGFAQGLGVLQWFENGQPAERYNGELRGGQMNGHGILNTGNGGRYEGEFRDGKANGLGTWTEAGGSFSGIWTNGCFKDGNRRAYVGTDPSLCP
jgi:hypothetical protein